MVHPGGLLALRLALRAVAKATLSFLVPAVNSATSSISSLLKISENMVHPGGFEPPTARFVAEYSIQLSYGCRIIKLKTNGGERGIRTLDGVFDPILP